MRYSIFILTFFYLTINAVAQSGDLKTYPSGLIYSDETMKQLDKIVDSLNSKFLSCELNKTFFSKPQGVGHYIYFESEKREGIKKALANNITFEDFVEQYKKAKITKNLLVVKSEYENYDNEKVIEFSGLGFSSAYNKEISFTKDLTQYKELKKGAWVVSERKGKDGYIEAFYFKTAITSIPIVEKYARMIQYADCMVDTSSQIFIERGSGKSKYNRYEVAPKVKLFLDYVNEATDKPIFNEKEEDYDAYYKELKKWRKRKTAIIEKDLQSTEKFKHLISAAAKNALKEGGSNNEFESYIYKYYSKDVALKLKRSRKVYGSCSMDSAPREHAKSIAKLSAETANWETFLRSHLDIMNDRFDRVAQSSYGDASFGTYIGELEALEINVHDLMLGISLRMDNPSENHYYGTVHRVGRALGESKYAQEIENTMSAMIADEKLDLYNRAVIYFLYRNYINYITDKSKKKANEEKLKAAIKQLPAYISSQISFEKD